MKPHESGMTLFTGNVQRSITRSPLKVGSFFSALRRSMVSVLLGGLSIVVTRSPTGKRDSAVVVVLATVSTVASEQRVGKPA